MTKGDGVTVDGSVLLGESYTHTVTGRQAKPRTVDSRFLCFVVYLVTVSASVLGSFDFMQIAISSIGFVILAKYIGIAICLKLKLTLYVLMLIAIFELADAVG